MTRRRKMWPPEGRQSIVSGVRWPHGQGDNPCLSAQTPICRWMPLSLAQTLPWQRYERSARKKCIGQTDRFISKPA